MAEAPEVQAELVVLVAEEQIVEPVMAARMDRKKKKATNTDMKKKIAITDMKKELIKIGATLTNTVTVALITAAPKEK